MPMLQHTTHAHGCTHARDVLDMNENDDRIRTIEVCRECGRKFFGCFAKRLDERRREAWGAVGVWTFSEVGD